MQLTKLTFSLMGRDCLTSEHRMRAPAFIIGLCGLTMWKGGGVRCGDLEVLVVM